ncbi:MAG: heme A synthase [Gemmatimonadaceae bacterium]|nr:heme A synthase [Gemmatimonadaceae bacterium]
MTAVRRLAYAALGLAFVQIVFGAIVRITGSGMGCGDQWPKCNGEWFPPHHRIDLIIEISHRYIALALSITVVALVILALSRRRSPEVSGSGGVLRPSALSGLLVVTAALLGAVTVKLGLNPFVIAAHLTVAMALLASLAVATFRAGGLGGRRDAAGLRPVMDAAGLKTHRAARIAVGLALVTLVMGALTANLPDAASSCGGFPWCRTINSGGTGLGVQIAHRVVAFLLFGHLWGMAAAIPRRGEPPAIVMAARVAFGAAVVQVLVAAAMLEMQFPPVVRSLHQAVGTFVWLAIVVLALHASRAARSAAMVVQQRVAA